jgi:hypothetical protein
VSSPTGLKSHRTLPGDGMKGARSVSSLREHKVHRSLSQDRMKEIVQRILSNRA